MTDAQDILERGRRYFPDVDPALFQQQEEIDLYVALIFCKEEQDRCIENADYLGALMAVSKLVHTPKAP